MNPAELIFIGSDNLVEWREPELVATGETLDNLTVTARLLDSAGSEVSGSSVSLSYNSTLGIYRGYIPATVSLTEGTTYTMEVYGHTASAAPRTRKRWKVRAVYAGPL